MRDRLTIPVVGALAVALVAIAGALWLGSQVFVGTFGVTGQVKSCGSVWDLLAGTGDLNAASCRSDLLDRLTLVGVLVGVAGIAAGFALLLLGRNQTTEGGRTFHPLAVIAVVVVPCLLSAAFVALGRHLAWSVSGY